MLHLFFNKQYFTPKLDCGEDEKMAVIFTKKKMLEKPKIGVRFPGDLGITSKSEAQEFNGCNVRKIHD